MDEALIDNWNKVVSSQDRVYHCGDLAFYRDQKKTREVLRRLKGQKHLILGNHDRRLESETLSLFASVNQYLELKVPDADVGRQLICLFHFAMRVFHKSHYGSWHLYGHSHGSLKDDPNSLSFDVGVDCWGFTPVSYQQVKDRMKQKVFKPIDHHGYKNV